MYIIWLYFEVLCSLKSFSCIVEVRPSRARKARSQPKPWTVQAVSCRWCDELVGPVIRKSVTPAVTATATTQSRKLYLLRLIAMPQTITGNILKLLPSICTGKEMNFSASYWQVVAKTFDREITTYFQGG